MLIDTNCFALFESTLPAVTVIGLDVRLDELDHTLGRKSRLFLEVFQSVEKAGKIILSCQIFTVILVVVVAGLRRLGSRLLADG